jgi:hypothetical protein
MFDFEYTVRYNKITEGASDKFFTAVG